MEKTKIFSIQNKLITVITALLLVQFTAIAVKDFVSLDSFTKSRVASLADLKHTAFENEIQNYSLLGRVLLERGFLPRCLMSFRRLSGQM